MTLEIKALLGKRYIYNYFIWTTDDIHRGPLVCGGIIFQPGLHGLLAYVQLCDVQDFVLT